MKNFRTFLIVFFIPVLFVFGWGDKGHKLIAKKALLILQSEIKFSDETRDAIILHSVDPDYRKKQDPTEPKKHFIDIDYYKEFLNGNMIESKDSLVKIYGDSIVTDQGTLPWATEDTYAKLVNAFKEKNKEKIILFASDLAHYVGDGHQPLHASINYNGQLSGQKGIHFRYEIEMIDRYLPELDSMNINAKPVYVKNLLSRIFDYITESNVNMDLILSSDKFALAHGNNKYEDDYYKLLWFRTKYVTENEISEGASMLASMIYSAWIDAGKPEINI